MPAVSPEEPKFLQFQDIVDQTRKSIVTYCPEWTDYNLSDPGITLIELFSWMTTQLNYRLNQVPKRNYLKFLELLGIIPKPPKPAATELTFYLSTPFPLTRASGDFDYTVFTRIRANTEVATRRATGNEPEIIFTTEAERNLKPPKLIHVRQDFANSQDGGELFSHNYLTRRLTNEGDIYEFERNGFYPFREESPHEGDAFYLGFDEVHDISGYLLQLDFVCPEMGAGVTPDNPPLVWECRTGEGEDNWQRLVMEEDTTKALTRDGLVKVHLPLTAVPVPIRGVNAYWIRCQLRVEDEENQKKYTRSPRIRDIKAYVLGLTVPAVHANPISNGEELGESNGDPSQKFSLSYAPLLPLDETRDEFVEVEEEQPDGAIRFVRWQQVGDFSKSSRYDRHFTLDTGTGEISFGPGIRQPNGEVRQCGAIPKLGRKIRISRYRTGGGIEGNVPAGSLRVLKQPINYVVEVTNRILASGGEDPESLEAAKLRAQETLRGRQRAVTGQDYEYLCQSFGYVARAKSLETTAGSLSLRPGWVKLLVVPKPGLRSQASKAKSVAETEEKAPPEATEKTSLDFLADLRVDFIRDQLRQDLEPYRVLGITLDIGEPTYLGIKIEAKVQCKKYADPKEVKEKVIHTLKDFITPMKPEPDEAGQLESTDIGRQNGTSPGSSAQTAASVWQWPFGRSLYISDVYAKIQAVEDVEHVTGVELAWCNLPLDSPISEIELTWKKVNEGVVPVPNDGLLCLLDYEKIEVSGSE